MAEQVSFAGQGRTCWAVEMEERQDTTMLERPYQSISANECWCEGRELIATAQAQARGRMLFLFTSLRTLLRGLRTSSSQTEGKLIVVIAFARRLDG